MEWNSFYLPLHKPDVEEIDQTLHASMRHIITSVLVAMTILFSVGVVFDARQVTSEPEPAIAASVPGPVALSCTHVRWCSKPIRRHYIGQYPLVAMVESPV